MMRSCPSRVALSDCKSGMKRGLRKSINSLLVVESHGFRSEEIVCFAAMAMGQAGWGQQLWHRVDFPPEELVSVLGLFDDYSTSQDKRNVPM
jgi:hypothetical protein